MTALGITPDIRGGACFRRRPDRGRCDRVKARFPQAMLMSAEPEAFDDHARSLRGGKREATQLQWPHHLRRADGVDPRRNHFRHQQPAAHQSLTASDAEVGTAVGFAFRELKLVVEPGGAVGLAALLAGRIDISGKNVVIVLSGGNVDEDLYAKLIA